MYKNGEGVIEDNVEAYAWFNVAAANGNKIAAENREQLKKNMTPEQIAEGRKRSREIMEAISKSQCTNAVTNVTSRTVPMPAVIGLLGHRLLPSSLFCLKTFGHMHFNCSKLPDDLFRLIPFHQDGD